MNEPNISEAYLRQRRARALVWLLAGLGLAAVGIVTFVNAVNHGGMVWSGAVLVGLIIAGRSIRTWFYATVALRQIPKR